MAKQKRIGVLTGGGDVPGLNACIKSIVNRAAEKDWQVVGFRRGWAGPMNVNPATADDCADACRVLDPRQIQDIDRIGGTMLHTSRTNPAKMREKDLPGFLDPASLIRADDGTFDCTDRIVEALAALGIDALIPIGGDDTLSFGAKLSAAGFPVIGVPKTMDNDVYGTDFCIGFGTAVSRSVELIDALRTPAASHERIAVIELFGRNSGETALISGYVSGADRVLISEVPFDLDRLANLVVADRKKNPMNYAVVLVSEGAHPVGETAIESGEPDAYGHKKLGGVGDMVSDGLQELTGIATLNQRLAYLMRAGAPNSLDRMVAANFGALAVAQLAAGNVGVMTALEDGNYVTVPIETCISGVKRVNVDEYYDKDEYRPTVTNLMGKPMFLG